ncbi:MAG TPA: acyl-CoA dehydrogenase family protein [Pseudonocardia sp.]|nr:acyl-CoA dehydrogenase family protein [Pseudonocardia sp.]
MRFALDAEQRQFADSLHELLADAAVPTAVRLWADGDPAAGLAVWKQLAELGVPGLAVPESAGGLGAHPVDLVVAFEQLGRHAVPGPVVESCAAVPTLLAEIGHRDCLAALADGELLATLVLPPHVPYALDADVAGLLLTADPAAGSVGLLDSAGTEPERSVDPTRRLFRPGPALPLAADVPGAVARAFNVGVLATAAQLVGLGAGLLEMAVAHAGRREQFGRPIGAFQAVAHQLADVHVGLELARPLLHGAAVALGSRSGTATRDISAAKVAAGTAAYRAARTALQVHGALGYTLEHDVAFWLTKARALIGAWGTPAVHRARVREALR